LQPGVRSAGLSEQVPVNVVFVGFDQSQVNQGAFLDGLPEQYKPIVRSRLFYGTVEELGIDYTYDYDVTYTSDAWEASFFSGLKGLATPARRTVFQDEYNAQAGTRDVGQNHFIDAPTVEKWLIDHAPSGVNTRQNTIFFVNWWGRSDFIDHVYTKFGEPDPDTGFDFGVNRDSRKIIAWGGTTSDDEETGLGGRGERRVWFFDLSAGPEAWGGSYEITSPDIDGDNQPDYRIPVAWEYAANGYRAPAELPGDLSKVARYAAINLMFTSSPLYPPYLRRSSSPGRSTSTSTPTRAGRVSTRAPSTSCPATFARRRASSSPRGGRPTQRTRRSAARLASATSSGSRTWVATRTGLSIRRSRTCS
jgi:hypothetical protein